MIEHINYFDPNIWSVRRLPRLSPVALSEPNHIAYVATSPDKQAAKRAHAPVNPVYDLLLILPNSYSNVERRTTIAWMFNN